MRTIAAFGVALQALALASIYRQVETLEVLAPSLLLLVVGATLATVPGLWPLIINTLIAALLFGAAASMTAAQHYWLDGFPALLLSVIAAGIPVAVILGLSRRLLRVWSDEMLVVNNPLFGGLKTLEGPARVLLLPFSVIRARIPRGLLEVRVVITDVNTRPRAGPLVPWSQNLRLVEFEFTLRHLPTCFRLLFGIPNKAELFQLAAVAVKLPRREAMLEPLFWVALVRELLQVLVDPLVRDEILRSRLNPNEILEASDELAARVVERLGAELHKLGLELCSGAIARAEPDESEAALRSREAMLMAQSRAVELQMAGDVLTALFERVADLSREHNVPIPTAVIETLFQGILPNGSPVTRIRTELGPYEGETARVPRQPWPSGGATTRLNTSNDAPDKRAA